ncbi:MAG: DUF4468 domain-containing protein [Bacteroides sp.]|jgi:hypothetical protein|nr:DUF4468 domain-containing protein [Bacteroides sp.]MCI1681536.1 DUF4468 domain-containing protein [Bacteroides sp.]
MKKLTQILITLFCLYLPATLHAQKDDNSKYLAGAVPETEGKVVFSKEFSIPGMSQDEIYNRMLEWITGRLKSNNNISRVVYTNQVKGQIVGIGEEWIVFSSSALSLDRTLIQYQLSVTCQPETCILKVEKIRYSYREGKEKYTAEEWITDKYALNKAQTKLVRGLAKWRRKTVDFVDGLCMEAAGTLSATVKNQEEMAQEQKEEKQKEEKSIATSGTMVITPNNQLLKQESSSKVNNQAVPMQGKSVIETKTSELNGYQQTAPGELTTDMINMGKGKLVVVIGTDQFNMTIMAANAGGSLGKTSGKAVIYTLFTPDQPYGQLEKAQNYVVRFYPTGENEPSIIMECKKLPSQAPMEGQPRMYSGEVVKVWTK